MTDDTIKLVIVFLYMAGLLLLGWFASKQVKDARDYFAANKTLGFWATAFSARATGESAWLLLGLTGLGAAVGIHGMWIVLGETLGVFLAWTWMAKPFKRLTDRYDSITVPDYLESRFRDTRQRIRKVAAVVLVVFVTIYVSAQIDATGTAFESFLGWNYYAGALTGFAVVLVYITTGGFLAVAWSDVVQGALMFLGLVILPIAGVFAAGGIEQVTTGLHALDPKLLSLSHGGWTLATVMSAVGGAMIGAGFLGSPQIVVRFIAMRSESEIGRGTLVAVIWTILADSGAVLSGMLGRYLLTTPGQDVTAVLGNGGQDVLPLMVAHIFPIIIVGIYVAIVLSAIMSTVDSLLVMAASAVVRDWYQQVKNPEMPDAELTSMARNVTVGLAVFALAISMAMAALVPGRTVFWFVIFGWSGLAATFCPTIILSIIWPGFTARGVIAAMLTGFSCVPLFKFVVFKLPVIGATMEPLSELPPAFVLSFVAAWLASVTDPTQAEVRAAVSDELASAKK
ncbi:MAG: sodium/proline symporter [Myxococcales bacterium]|nr:sodium/proline symporter [Myxococcales bacterium]